MTITAGLVKELREKTGVGMMDCKKALVNCSGDLSKAAQYLREKGLVVATKKSERSASQGRVFTATDGSKGAILILNCETDFVGNNQSFIDLGERLVSVALTQGLSDIAQLEDASIDGKDIKTVVSDVVLQVGENIVLDTLQNISANGSVSTYIHMNGKIGVLVSFSGPVEDSLGRDISMHVAAVQPQYVSRDVVDATHLDEERQVLRTQMLNEGKPDAIIDKIVEGKIGKFYKEVCLLEQPFVKNGDVTIAQTLPDGVTIENFVRLALG